MPLEDTHERISWNVDRNRTLGFPPAASKSPRKERPFTVLSPAARSLPRFRLGEEKTKTHLLTRFIITLLAVGKFFYKEFLYWLRNFVKSFYQLQPWRMGSLRNRNNV